MDETETRALLDDLNAILSQDTDYLNASTLLYIEVGNNWGSVSIFKDLGNHILYRSEWVMEAASAVIGRWHPAEGEPEAAKMMYVVRDGRFEFLIDPCTEDDLADSSLERRQTVIEREFGAKPVLYPPLADDDFPTYEI